MRTSGVLMHISSLSSPWGIGTFGRAAYDFVDFLHAGGQTQWQILPLGPTSYGDSPYQSFSSFAGNPYFIDLDLLAEKGLLYKDEYQHVFWGDNPESVDYGTLYKNRYPVLRRAVNRFHESTPADYTAFISHPEQHWLADYALFMSIKGRHGDRSWLEWEDAYRFRQPEALETARQEWSEDVTFWKTLQYLFYQQWRELKGYANAKGIAIVGDIPIYTAMDSADVWANTQEFYLDDNLHPIDVSGVPPDAFSADGQLWGNPLFRWDVMKENGYQWWVRRLGHMTQLYDVTRIDHFRGFDSYFAIPAEATTARHGEWRQGPGMDLFRQVQKTLGDPAFIAEDLGFLTPSVLQLVADTGYPGMKILQFAFDSRDDSDYLPHNYTAHNVVYTGTHDNDTIMGWFNAASPEDTAFAVEYLRLTKDEGYHWGMMKSAWASVAQWVVVQAQDLLGLDNSARMNVPSTMGTNWKWRALPGVFTPALADKIARQTSNYRRLPASLHGNEDST